MPSKGKKDRRPLKPIEARSTIVLVPHEETSIIGSRKTSILSGNYSEEESDEGADSDQERLEEQLRLMQEGMRAQQDSKQSAANTAANSIPHQQTASSILTSVARAPADQQNADEIMAKEASEYAALIRKAASEQEEHAAAEEARTILIKDATAKAQTAVVAQSEVEAAQKELSETGERLSLARANAILAMEELEAAYAKAKLGASKFKLLPADTSASSRTNGNHEPVQSNRQEALKTALDDEESRLFLKTQGKSDRAGGKTCLGFF